MHMTVLAGMQLRRLQHKVKLMRLLWLHRPQLRVCDARRPVAYHRLSEVPRYNSNPAIGLPFLNQYSATRGLPGRQP